MVVSCRLEPWPRLSGLHTIADEHGAVSGADATCTDHEYDLAGLEFWSALNGQLACVRGNAPSRRASYRYAKRRRDKHVAVAPRSSELPIGGRVDSAFTDNRQDALFSLSWQLRPGFHDDNQ